MVIHTYPDDEALMEATKEWQRVLRLQDWNVRARIARRWEMREGNVAQADYQLQTKTAVIKLLDPVDYEPDPMTPLDHEQWLVHELIHLHFAPFWEFEQETIQYKFAELAVDILADSFVRLKRQEG